MSEKLQKIVPKLRFPNFSDDWKTKSISRLIAEEVLFKPLDGNHGNIHPKASGSIVLTVLK